MAEFELTIRGETKRVRVEPDENGRYRVTLDDQTHEVEARRTGTHAISMLVGERSIEARVARDGDRRFVAVDGHRCVVTVPERSSGAAAGGGAVGDGRVTTPMPGKVVAVKVAAGDVVAEGDTLVIVEAMKMEHDLRAPFDGKVAAVHCQDGAAVQFGDVVAEVEPTAD